MADAKARVGASSARPRRRAAVLQVIAAAVAHVLIIGGAASADTSCRQGQPFGEWLAAFRGEAAGQGISPATLAALDGVTADPRVLKQDRGQPTLSQSFLDFAGRVVSADRLARGRALLKKHAPHSRRSSGTLAFPVR